MKLINSLDLKNGKRLEMWDFSQSNRSEKDRYETVSGVASICFQSTGVDPKKLYDKLYTESIGLPSSSFEFVPVVVNEEMSQRIDNGYASVCNLSKDIVQYPNIMRFGTLIAASGSVYTLTNLRAVLSDIEFLKQYGITINIDELNSNLLGEAIALRNFFVFKIKADISCMRQLMRHRVSWQEMSRRYVSAKKVPFEFLVNDDMKKACVDGMNYREYFELSTKFYEDCMSNGAHQQEARRFIPVCQMTEVWMAADYTKLINMLKLRTKSSTQQDTREIAIAMTKMLKQFGEEIDEKRIIEDVSCIC